MNSVYNANPNLKAARVDVQYTKEQVEEYIKCCNDPVYFIETYAKIVSLDKGVVPFILFPYQRRIIKAIHENKHTLAKLFRQSGKSTVVAGYFAWYILFNNNKTAVILANKQAIAVEIFSRVQFIIENTPKWLQQGVVEWNKKSLVLENGSKCIAAATSASAVRGMSANILLCDEFAHLSPSLADEFIASVFPTLSSAKTSKLIIVSTPNGLNHYHKLWMEAKQGLNDFKAVEGHWTENPTRDQTWADQQKSQLGEVKYRQEIECSFEGSSYTLIDGVKLASFVTGVPLYDKDFLEIFERPIENHSYLITVDVSRGQHHDYSAFVVTDITQMPYKVVVTYKNNGITTLEIPHLIYNTAKQYNDAHILVEVNDLGQEVSNILWHEYEYENLYFTINDKVKQNKGYPKITNTGGFPGVRTTARVKSLGCSVLKDLIEKDQYILNSYKIIQELGVFVAHKKSYAAENTMINDDLCTCLWLFAWMTKQPIFQELTNTNIRAILTSQKQEYIDSTMTPFGFYYNAKEHLQEELEKENKKLPFHSDFRTLTEDQIELLKN